MAAERRARIERIVEHRPGLRSLFLRTEGASLAFEPGQFVSLLLPVGPRPPLTRAYSIASSPEQRGVLELCLDRVPGGLGSGHLFELGVGTELAWTGPWGSFSLSKAPDVETVFVADRTGIAPVRPMLHRAAASARQPLHLLYAHDAGLFRDELARLPHLTITDTRPDHLERYVRQRWIGADARRDRGFFVRGVGEVVYRLRDVLRGAGYARRAVHYERW